MATTEKKAKKAPTATEKNTKDIKELKGAIGDLGGKLDQLAAMFAQMMTEKAEAKVEAKTEPDEERPTKVEAAPVEEEVEKVSQAELMNNPDQYKVSATDEISFVHLVQRGEGLSTYVKLSTTELNLSLCGEIFSLSRAQADEFIGKYRKWFDDGVFGVYNDEVSIRYAKIKKIRTAGSYAISRYNLDSIGDLNYADLEELVNKLAPAHKDNIIQYFKQKIYEGLAVPERRDNRFMDLRKLEILNRLSGCDSLQYEIEDIKKAK